MTATPWQSSRMSSTKQSFTAVVSAGDIRPKIAELCLVSLAGESADYLGISQAGQRVATGLKRVAVSRCIHLGGINIVELKSFMSSRFASKLNSFSNNTQRIPPGLWKDMLNAIVSLRPQINNSVVSLRKLVEEYNEPHHRRRVGSKSSTVTQWHRHYKFGEEPSIGSAYYDQQQRPHTTEPHSFPGLRMFRYVRILRSFMIQRRSREWKLLVDRKSALSRW